MAVTLGVSGAYDCEEEHQMADSDRSVTVLGLGPMGQAMVRALLDAGVAVTVWNRTAGRADAMVALGAARAGTVAEALAANQLIIVSLNQYQALYEVLGQAPDRLAGKIIANLSSGSPGQARAGANWVIERGGQFLTGGFMSLGDAITHPLSYLYISGPEEVFHAAEQLLRPLSPLEYLGTDYGLAQVYYQAQLIMFHPMLLAFEQATAMLERSGGDIDRFASYTQHAMESFKLFTTDFAGAIKAGDQGDLATLTMMETGTQHIIDASEEVGVDAALSRAAQQYWRRAIAASEHAGRPVSTYRLIRGED
jgi:3-hydroxyisobutyrate dehydrogenase-like beta-hydroxyacid dehydrogenase